MKKMKSVQEMSLEEFALNFQLLLLTP